MSETIMVTIYGRYGWGGLGRCLGGDGGIEGVWGVVYGEYSSETGVRAKNIRESMFVSDRMHACMQKFGVGEGMQENLTIGVASKLL